MCTYLISSNPAQTIDEFGMVQNGDRILIALSGSSASLAMLHALRQFVHVRQLPGVELAAVMLSGADGGLDPRALMVYLRDLGVRFHCEPLGEKFGVIVMWAPVI